MTPQSALPTRKVGAGALAGAVSTIIIWIISATGLDVPPEVASAITFILMFGASYVIPEGQIVEDVPPAAAPPTTPTTTPKQPPPTSMPPVN